MKIINPPTTPSETRALHDLLRSNPQQYLETVNRWIADDPGDAPAYFSRHLAWMRLGQPQRALEDLDKAIELRPQPVDFLSRGNVRRHLGQYRHAIEDYRRGEAMDPAQWAADGFGLLMQADAHARLGELTQALDCCRRLPDDFWTPGMYQSPAGDKAAIADRLRVLAAEVGTSGG